MPEEAAWRFARYHFTKGGWDVEKLATAPKLSIEALPRLEVQMADELVNANFHLVVKFSTLEAEETVSTIILKVVGIYATTFQRDDENATEYAREIGQHAIQRLPPLAIAEAMRIMKMAGVESPIDLPLDAFSEFFDFYPIDGPEEEEQINEV